MSEFINQLATPGFWLSQVVIAFLVNIAAGFAVPWMIKAMARHSKTLKARTQGAKETEEAIVNLLIDTPFNLVDARTDAIYTALRIILLLVVGSTLGGLVFSAFAPLAAGHSISLFYSLNLVGALIQFVCLIIALWHFKRYRKLVRVIDKAASCVFTFDDRDKEVAERILRDRIAHVRAESPRMR